MDTCNSPEMRRSSGFDGPTRCLYSCYIVCILTSLGSYLYGIFNTRAEEKRKKEIVRAESEKVVEDQYLSPISKVVLQRFDVRQQDLEMLGVGDVNQLRALLACSLSV